MDYIKHFIKEEDAVEAMEWMAIVAVAAVLITIAAKCGAFHRRYFDFFSHHRFKIPQSL